MYQVSDNFIKAIQSNSRSYCWTGEIKTKKGQKYTFENKDNVKGSGYITRQCCGNTEIELGTVYAAEMGISLFTDIDRYSLEDGTITGRFVNGDSVKYLGASDSTKNYNIFFAKLLHI